MDRAVRRGGDERERPWLRERSGPVFSAQRVSIGRFRRHPSQPDFADTGPVQETLVVFPRLPVRIAQEGRRAVVADASVATLYNPGQRYMRGVISPLGDRCDWFSFQGTDVAEALAARGPAVDPERPFSEPCVPVEPAQLLRARALFALAAGEAPVDPLWLEEESLSLLGAVLGSGLAPRPCTPAARALADGAAALLGRRFTEPLTLGLLGRVLGASPFQLCRAFRSATGSTVHRHLTALRLAAALEQLSERRGDLSALALELGFSHHAHFTAAFRRHFGQSPSGWLAQRAARTR